MSEQPQLPMSLDKAKTTGITEALEIIIKKNPKFTDRLPRVQALSSIRALKQLQVNLVGLEFYKKDGTRCTRLGTLNQAYCPCATPIDNPINLETGYISYYDLRGKKFKVRQFHVSMLLSFEPIYNLERLI